MKLKTNENVFQFVDLFPGRGILDNHVSPIYIHHKSASSNL